VTDRERHRTELLLDLSPKDERTLVKQDVTTLTKDLGKEYRLDQSISIIERRKLHGLFSFRVNWLGRSQHPCGPDISADMAMQIGAGTKPELGQLLGMQVHWMSIGHEAENLAFLSPAPLGGVLL
jgi:hypothetical protein